MIIEVTAKGPLYDGKFAAIMDKEYKLAMVDSVLKLETEVAKGTPVYTGTLRAGITGRAVTPYVGKVGVAGPAAKYGDVVEKGRRPGKFPPVGILNDWVVRVLKVEKKRAKQVAYLVGRKIAKKGIKGKFMFRNAEKKYRRWVVRRFEKAQKRVDVKVSDR